MDVRSWLAAAVILGAASGVPVCASAGQNESVEESRVLDFINGLDQARASRRYPGAPIFTRDEYLKALRGETIVRASDAGGEKTMMLLQVSAIPAWKLWATFIDRDHYETTMQNIRESVNISVSADGFLTYVYTDPPVIFVQDRQQVLESAATAQVWQTSERRVWEYTWHVPPEPAKIIDEVVRKMSLEHIRPSDIDKAVIIPRNDSAWLFVVLPDGRTVMEAVSRNDLGGSIPRGMASGGGGDAMKKMLSRVTAWISHEFDRHFSQHEKLLGPDGQYSLPGGLAELMPR